jgi:hypothetical protein
LKSLFSKKSHVEPQREEPTRLFVHIPKTAGTSFRTAVESRFGRSRVLRDYGPDSDATSDSVREEVYQKKDAPNLNRAISRNNAILIAGHVPITKYGGHIGLRNTIILFRDPVEQVISHHRHAVRNQEYQGDLISFAKSEKARNIQSRILANVDPGLVGIVGLTEKYRETLAIIEHRWGWNLRHKKMNVSGRLSISQPAVSDEEKKELERLNQSDRQLYTRARKVFNNTWWSMEKGTGADPRGAITQAAAETGINGWALDTLSDRPLEVEILVNGISRSSLTCDLPVPELLRWNIPRNGHVGFKAETGSLEIGDCIEIRDTGSGLTLSTWEGVQA